MSRRRRAVWTSSPPRRATDNRSRRRDNRPVRTEGKGSGVRLLFESVHDLLVLVQGEVAGRGLVADRTAEGTRGAFAGPRRGRPTGRRLALVPRLGGRGTRPG